MKMKKGLILLAMLATTALGSTQSAIAAEGGECWFPNCRPPTPTPKKPPKLSAEPVTAMSVLTPR
jgi:hypothetical protein